jgi:hypothetical protein
MRGRMDSIAGVPDHPPVGDWPIKSVLRGRTIVMASTQFSKGFSYSFNIQGRGRCAALSRSVRWNDGLASMAGNQPVKTIQIAEMEDSGVRSQRLSFFTVREFASNFL